MTSPSPNSPRSATADERLAALFPDLASGGPRRRKRFLAPVAAVILVSGIVVGIAASQASGSDTGNYRTARAAIQDIDDTLAGVATIEPVSQAAVAFPVSGTVKSVSVAVGDQVSLGQELATLDTTSLEETLHTRQAALAQAKLQLADRLDAAEAATTTTTTPASSSPSAASAPNGGAAPGGGSSDAIGSAKKAVVEAQAAVNDAQHAADEALASAAAVCATGSDPADPNATTTTTSTPDPSATTACQQAQVDVSTAQAAVSTAQHRLTEAAIAFNTAVDAQSQASNSSTNQATAASSQQSAPSIASSSGPTGGANGGTPSAEDLIAAQQAVDAAFAQVIVATQAIDQATIVSPINGTVVGVALAVGDDVTAGSSTAAVTIVGSGGYEITTRISVDDIAKVKVGQRAEVVPDGVDAELEGQVVSVSVAPEEGTTSTTYLVVVGLADPKVELNNGSTGSVAIVTEEATQALAVPTSAVHTTGERHTVTKVSGTATKDIEVTVGVKGDTWTEIRDGLSAGDEVVLADLDEALPGSATESSGDGGGDTNTSFVVPGGGGGNFPAGGPPAFANR